ncbi:PD-(D/E)XK nuclease family protein [uncultured Brevundimonas sp.]|uniref:PD-(D/E)XK nuclease family protein n=1 Tax=uncultured Brevundimonas sp. TaxID=213418 RepID=UPI0030EF94ED|tara:strand:+ start:8263 stop:10875 length:2613 start_codon:yes stop_codon:yes gene_type:complete
MRQLRLEAARQSRHGLQILSFEQLAVRLAGGFCRSIDDESLRIAIQATLPVTAVGELEGIKTLPGMVAASAGTLKKAWHAGVDLAGRPEEHPRLDAIARLEAGVLARLPAGMLRPCDLVAAACDRLDHAPAVLGPVEIVGVTELSPCWRPLLSALAGRIQVTWTAGPRPTPSWLEGMEVTISREDAQAPAIEAVSAATAYHEAIEALRWARALLASGEATPSEIAIAAASTGEYDDHLFTLRADANLDLHFVHGIKVVTTRDGQAAAALADILVRGLSQPRLRRLAVLCGSEAGPFESLPDNWMRVLPPDAPLGSMQAWDRLLNRLTPGDWPDGRDHVATLRPLVALLLQGHAAAELAGQTFLTGRARAIWRKVLLAGPAASLDATLDTLKQDDGLEACVSVAWMPASALAASPRKFVRLVGMNSSRWPRAISEDRLIPDHVIPKFDLDPLPVDAADRRDFETILATTHRQIVLSRARRDGEGRLLGRSAMTVAMPEEVYIRRNATPAHAFSETDRLMARRDEFAGTAQAESALAAWRDWHRPEITAHDGRIRPDHPLLLAILERTQSASSLRRLLRNPLAFVWRYALSLKRRDVSDEPLVLDALQMGNLVHMTLDMALSLLEAGGGLAGASDDEIEAAVQAAASEVAVRWEAEQAAPPEVIWRRTLEEARMLTTRSLTFGDEVLADATSYGEAGFGGSEPRTAGATPWDPSRAVEIPDTGFRISGYIDRLDVSGDGQRALVRDYKTGKPPKDDIVINGGKELQRCLYAFAVKAMLGNDVAITASLLYPRVPAELVLADPEATLADITGHLQAARASLISGEALPGPDAGGSYDDLSFALPANAAATYCKRKTPAVVAALGDAALVWDAL